jgi:hypothetical protein
MPLMAGRRFLVLWIFRGTGTECGHFENLILEMEVCKPETAPDETAVAEKALYLVGGRVSDNVKVLWRAFEKDIPNAPSDQIGDKSVIMEPVKGPECIWAELPAGDGVIVTWNDPWLHGHQHSTTC